jgi:hypothetical protein
MAEKVVTVNVRAGTLDKPLMEIGMESVNALLDNGYIVKQIVPIPFQSSSNLGFTTIVFVLEKRAGGTVM